MSKNKKNILMIVILVVVIGAGWGTIKLFQYYQYRISPQYQTQKYLEEMEKKYREDTYGGSTPEETLQLFIDALKKGDIDLASKYFVVDKQEEWKNYLNENNIENLINEASKLKLSKKDDKRAFFIIVNDKNIVEVQVILNKNINNKWKIESL